MHIKTVFLAVFFIALGLFAFYSLTSAKTVGYAVTVPTVVTEVVNQTVPSPIEEEYPEEEFYEEEVCRTVDLEFSVENWSGTYACLEEGERCVQAEPVCETYDDEGICQQFTYRCTEKECLSRETVCSFVLRNDDDEQGTFSFSMQFFEGDDGRMQTDPRDVTLSPGGEQLMEWHYAMNEPYAQVDCNYVAEQVPQKEECETVVRSRIVTRTRIATHYVTDQVPINRTVEKEETRYKTVNRVFGYPQGFDWGY